MNYSYSTRLRVTILALFITCCTGILPGSVSAEQPVPVDEKLTSQLYGNAVELEDAAKSESDYYRAIEAYRLVIKHATEETPEDRVAAAQFAIGEILFSNLKQYQEAEKEFEKVIDNYPDTSWPTDALRRIAACQDFIAQNGRKSPSLSPQWLNRQSSASTPGSGPPAQVIFYDPALLTPDMYEEVDPAEAQAELDRLHELASIPHLSPIPISEATTGPSLVKGLYKDILDRDKKLNDYSCTLDIFLDDNPELTVELKVSGNMVRVEIGDLVFITPTGQSSQKDTYLYFPGTGQFLNIAKSGSSEGKTIARNLKKFLQFIDLLDKIEDTFYLDYSSFQDEEYLVDIIPKAEEAKLSATIWISHRLNSITALQVINLESSQTIVSAYCRNWRFNSNLAATLFSLPESSTATSGIPSSVTVPEALLQ